ncbi:hypothetical protein [Roseivirga seohaensis]|uniref:hypothetical protein n=1 Tax=Roseivirga seohaensis TaxID=1914963 RepID=UPI003BA85AF4
MKIRVITLIGLSFLTTSLFAQNLLNMSGWTIGTGSTTGFSQNGSTSENTREWGEGPHGSRAILWKASPDGNIDADGGWNSDYISIDHTKMYRFTVWMKKTGSHNGSSYLGCTASGAPVTGLNNVVNSNPYFWYGDLPELNKWFLVVGYIHGSGDNSTTTYGGIYDGTTGRKYNILEDFKFQTTTTAVQHRSFLFYDPATSDRQYFYAPRVDEVNGNEPTIAELLGILSTSLDQLSVGTNNLPTGYKLSVGGDAIMEKVKVQTESAWPDYVFKKGYQLTSLDSLQAFINKYGHLPNIPSAQEIGKSNQDLGLIQLKHLEKIEELTLYIIELKKEIDHLKKEK